MSVLYRFPAPSILLLYVLAACSTSADSETTRYYEFTHRNEPGAYTFVAQTADQEVIARAQEQLKLPLEERNLHIHGDIARGKKEYNSTWSWHFEPEAWDLVEISAEVCDGRPQMVEEDLDYWVDQVGYFCPWSSVVTREVHLDE